MVCWSLWSSGCGGNEAYSHLPVTAHWDGWVVGSSHKVHTCTLYSAHCLGWVLGSGYITVHYILLWVGTRWVVPTRYITVHLVCPLQALVRIALALVE